MWRIQNIFRILKEEKGIGAKEQENCGGKNGVQI